MCELNELAWAYALAEIGGEEAPDANEELPRLTRLFDEEQNPALLLLQKTAHERGVPFLWDDDEVSVGYGRTTRVWTPDHLPSPQQVDWDEIESIPVAMVTGTNGKSTTVRMTAAIMTCRRFSRRLNVDRFYSRG